MLLVLFCISLLIFSIAKAVPGDPVRVSLGPLATEEMVQKLREKMHYNEPFFAQYYFWLRSVFQGDLGKSLYTQRPVTEDLKEFIPATIELMIVSFFISLAIGQVMGVLAGYFRDSWFDNLFRVFSYIGIATPSFAIAILLLIFFSSVLNFAPLVGRLSMTLQSPPRISGLFILDGLIAGQFGTAFEAFKHLLLPAISLAVANIAQEGRITRSSVIENLEKDYIIAHKVYGIPVRVILSKYLLKPSLIPTVAIMSLGFVSQLGNAFLVEAIFMWPGFSRYGTTVLLNKDLNAIVAVVLVIGVAYSIINIITDIIVSFLDPRIRLQEGSV